MSYPEDVERYRQMQKAYYSGIPAADGPMKDAVVGCFEAHESYPYERYLLASYGPGADLSGLKALDFGCGPGRMIRRLGMFFGRVDGVDISPTCIEAARRWTADLGYRPALYVNDGVVLDGVPSGEYDFVYSTIAFHHINSWPIRMSLLNEFFRVLKPGGRIAIQMFYTTSPRDQWAQHTSWREARHDAPATNGYFDVRITPDNLPQVKEDVEDVGFVDFHHEIAPYPPPPHPKGPSETDWVFLYARKP